MVSGCSVLPAKTCRAPAHAPLFLISTMKTILLLGILAPLALLQGAESSTRPVFVANTTNRFTVTGMHCGGCANGICSELKRTKGVTAATVSLTNRLAVVAYDNSKVSVKKLVKVIQEAGYAAKPLKD